MSSPRGTYRASATRRPGSAAVAATMQTVPAGAVIAASLATRSGVACPAWKRLRNAAGDSSVNSRAMAGSSPGPAVRSHTARPSLSWCSLIGAG